MPLMYSYLFCAANPNRPNPNRLIAEILINIIFSEFKFPTIFHFTIIFLSLTIILHI